MHSQGVYIGVLLCTYIPPIHLHMGIITVHTCAPLLRTRGIYICTRNMLRVAWDESCIAHTQTHIHIHIHTHTHCKSWLSFFAVLSVCKRYVYIHTYYIYIHTHICMKHTTSCLEQDIIAILCSTVHVYEVHIYTRTYAGSTREVAHSKTRLSLSAVLCMWTGYIYICTHTYIHTYA